MKVSQLKYTKLAQAIYGIFRSNYSAYHLWRYADRKPIKLVIGANFVHQKGWIPTDIENLNILKIDSWQTHFQQDSIDAILAEHVWEHLTPEQAAIAIANCHTYLKRGGYIRIAVPDGNHHDPAYIDAVKPGGTGKAAWDHKLLYTYQTLGEAFRNQGFDVKKLEYFDEHQQFHYTEWNKEEGMIHRSSRYDKRNAVKPLTYTSLILDAIKA